MDIKTPLSKLKIQIKKKKVYIPAIAVVLILLGYFAVGSKKSATTDTVATVVKRDFAQIVSVTGRVKASSEVSLAFEKSGRVKAIYKAVGDQVYAGEYLVSLENADLFAQLAQANASTKAQQAKLDELKRGSTPEEIAVQEIEVANAKITLADAQRSLSDALVGAYTNIDDVVSNKTDFFFNNPRSISPQFNLQADSQLKSNIESGRLAEGIMLTNWNPDQVKQNLSITKNYLDLIAQVVNALTTGGSNLSQTTIDSYKATVNTARTTILSQISAVTSADQAGRSAQSALTLSQSELDLKKAPTRPEQILAQEAQVEAAQANADSVQAQLNKTILRSPINGIVTAKNVEVGEIVAANTIVVGVISENAFKIEASVAESDIANIKVGDKADVTLDAYNDIHFDAQVATVDPAEVIIEGVPTYKATLVFLKPDPRIRSGMTANTDTTTAVLTDALPI